MGFFADASGIVFSIYPTPMVNKIKNEKSAILCVWWGVIITRKPIHFPWELFHGILATEISAHCLRNHLTKLHSIGTGGTRYQIQTCPCACFKCKKNKKKCIDADIQELFRD